MSDKRNALFALAAFVILAAAFYRVQSTREPAPPRVNVAVVTGGSGPYWQLVANGAKEAAGQFNVDLDLALPAEDENVEQQTKLLEKIDPAAVDGVAVSPLDAKGQSELIDQLAAKADVITFDSDAPETHRLSYIGTINVQAGRLAADLVREAAPNGGKIALVFANLTKDNMLGRQEGFDLEINRASEGSADGVAPKYEVIDRIIDGGDLGKCRVLVTKAIADHDDLVCLVGMNAQHGAVLLDILKELDKLGKIAVIAFDEQKETLDGIEAGSIYGAVMQDPYRYGYDAVRVLAAYSRGDATLRPLKGSFSTFGVAPISVKKDTLAEFRRELETRLAGTKGS